MVALVAANAVFTAGEFALVASDRTKISMAAEAGSRRAKLVEGMVGRLAFYLSGAQLGITITSIVLGFLAEPLVGRLLHAPVAHVVGEHVAHGVALTLALVLTTVVQLVAAELVPKNVAVARPERTAMRLAVPLRGYTALFGPLITVLNASANAIVRRLGIEPREELESVRNLDELDLLVRSSGDRGTLAPEATRLLSRSIRFADKPAADAMLPRLEVEALPATTLITELAAAAVRTGISRFPVTGADLDDVIGVVLAKDAFRVPYAERSFTAVAAVMGPVLAVPESRPLGSLLVEMRQTGNQLAVVIDEYGGTAGIVTLEDVLEEIVGAIGDEYDEPELTPAPSTDGAIVDGVVVDGTLRPDDVADATGLVMPDGDYDTLAGFVLTLFDRIPAAGDVIDWNGWSFEVVELDRLRIASIAVRPPPSVAPTEPGGAP